MASLIFVEQCQQEHRRIKAALCKLFNSFYFPSLNQEIGRRITFPLKTEPAARQPSHCGRPHPWKRAVLSSKSARRMVMGPDKP
jgi:hypothetical protein